MKKISINNFTSILLNCLLFSFSFSQLPWSPSQILCDSTGENMQPSFVRYSDALTDYNILLWSRNFGNYSKILLKDFANPDSEIVLSPFGYECISQNPSGSSDYDSDSILIVWQAKHLNNFDLYSIEYNNGQISNLQQITDNPSNDINPQLMDRYLVWQRDSSIYFSFYSTHSSSWEYEFLVDSAGCSNPAINITFGYPELTPIVVFEKKLGGSVQIFSRRKENNQTWNDLQNISLTGNNRNPDFNVGIPESVLWESQNGEMWSFKIYSYSLEDTFSIISGHSRFNYPCGLLIPSLVDQFYGPMLIAFESDYTGDPEIYANVWPFDFEDIYNISQYDGKDHHPTYSAAAWGEARVEDLRYWIAWEREVNNKIQIMGSYSEMAAGAVGKKNKMNIASFELDQNYPNPFNAETVISYYLQKRRDIEISIFNIRGQKICQLYKGTQSSGKHKLRWDGRDNEGFESASGIYFLKLETENFIITRKMIMLH
jgi:hypothetical protein